ncbi:MAG TPA: hypothetical protein VHE30_15210 [Polyangiaceae bacterium]|nr:hypothetical protein [Polyangiaceae bacterium]
MRQGVKCLLGHGSALPAFLARARLAGLAFLALLAALATTGTARAQLLLGQLGPNAPRPPAPLDDAIPKGAEVVTPARPKTGPEPPACSLRYAACVHRAAGVAPGTVLDWVRALDTAFDRLEGALRLPPPLPDWDRGGTPGLDVYLAPGAPDLDVSIDATDVGVATDRASAFCVASATGVAVERRATLCLAEAVLLRLDGSETPFVRRALATSLWLATGSPTSDDVRAFDDVQAHPERGVLARDRSDASEGSALLFEYLDAAKGRGEPCGASLATYSLSAKTESPAGRRFLNEPDVADVLRATFGPTPTDTARFFSDFAVARAFTGSRDAEGLLPTLAFLGDLGRVRFEWSIPFASLPRRLAPARAIEPLGSTYLWLSLGPEAHGKSLAFQADWEEPVAFRWALVLLDGDGKPLRRYDVPFLERGTHVERIVSDLGGGAGLLVVGTNLGGLGPSYPFDPDFEPFEPHAYAVTLSAL